MSLAAETISHNVTAQNDQLKAEVISQEKLSNNIDLLAASGAARVEDAAITQWISLADLMQVKCMTLKLAELLITSGIHSINQLRNCIPENLHQRLAEINEQEKLLERAPLYMQVMEMVVLAKWVAES